MKLLFFAEEVVSDVNITWDGVMKTIVEWATTVGVKLIVALLLWFVSFKVINICRRRLTKKLNKKNADKTISKVLTYVFSVGLKIIVLICLLGYVGIETTSISAVIASLGVGAGLALNGALANFAGGVLIFITRPFRIDDYINACGVEGTVEDIRIINTVIRTIDNKVIFIPNGSLSTGVIINYSIKELRRVDLVFSISYSADYDKAVEILTDICNSHPLVLDDPKPAIRMTSHASSSIDIYTKVWVKNSDYWTVHADLLETVKKSFDAANIEIPFEQLEVRVKKD